MFLLCEACLVSFVILGLDQRRGTGKGSNSTEFEKYQAGKMGDQAMEVLPKVCGVCD